MSELLNKHTIWRHGAFVILLSLTGCATLENPDPLEPMNRKVFAFNQAADDWVVKPVSQGYRWVLPKFMRRGIDNFFNNVTDTSVIINDLLQLKIKKTGNDLGRLVINTTLGVGGVMDIAAVWGWERAPLTFGDTLSVYGWQHSAYLVLPFAGPSTIRDTIGMVPDWYLSPWGYIEPEIARVLLYGLYSVNTRAGYLDLESILKVASFDEYILIRDAYLQRRLSRLSGGDLEDIDIGF